MRPIAGIIVGLLGLAAALGGVSVLVARRILAAGRVRYSEVLPGSTDESVRLATNPVTGLPGRYALEFEDGSRVVVGEVTRTDAGDGSVRRAVLNGRVPDGATRARFTGASVTPADLGASGSDEAHLPRTPSGAWRFGSDLMESPSTGSTWVVHTHGLGASPLATLRSVRAVQRAGLPSLVVSLGSTFAERRTGAEAGDVASVIAAIDDAVALGATRVVVCGWSYGAALSLAAARERHHAVTAAILVSPMLSLRDTVLHAAKTQSIPRVLARSALAVLETPLLATFAGARGALPVRTLSQGLVAGLPTLVIHSPGDLTIPIELTRDATRTSRESTLVELPAAPHGLEWNVAPDAFESTVGTWLAETLQAR